jgi:Zn-dependent protease
MANQSLGGLFITFLLMIIGLALTGTVATSVSAAVVALVGFDSAIALANLIPLLWVIIILAIGVAAIYVQFKGMSG